MVYEGWERKDGNDDSEALLLDVGGTILKGGNIRKGHVWSDGKEVLFWH